MYNMKVLNRNGKNRGESFLPKRRRLIFAAIALIVAALPLLAACEEGGEPYQPYEPKDTFLSGITAVSLSGGDSARAKDEIYKFLDDLETEISAQLDGTNVDEINRAGAGEKVKAKEHTAALFNLSRHYHELTGGAFNPALLPLSQAWGFGEGLTGRIPGAEEISVMLGYCDFSLFELEDGYITKSDARAKLDFGAIAKGYAADKCMEIAGKWGVVRGTIDIGGNIYVIGEKENGSAYVAGIRDPRRFENGHTGYFARIDIKQTSIVTSGDYEQYFVREGVRYCHIIDPATGAPTRSGLISVTLVGQSSAELDALSTALFVMGMDAAKAFAEANSVSAVLVNESYDYWTNAAIYAVFSAYSEYGA